jgi:hypothetical protein
MVRLQDLQTRPDLNGRVALVVGREKELAEQRTTPDLSRLSCCLVGEDGHVQGLRLAPHTVQVVHPPPSLHARAWIQLGGAYAHGDVPSEAMCAFEEAFELAARHVVVRAQRGEEGGESAADDLAAVRAEGCRALANMAFLCVHMSRQGVEWTSGGKRNTGKCFEWAMRTLFHDVLAEAKGTVTFGVGTLPTGGEEREKDKGEKDTEQRMPVLLVKEEREGENGEKIKEEGRYFFFDEERGVVREHR